MKNKEKEKFPWGLFALCLFLTALVTFLTILLVKLGQDRDRIEREEANIDAAKQVDIVDLTPDYDALERPYIGDTIYDGTTQLPKEVFQIPFYYPFSDMLYEPNKQFIRGLKDKEIQSIMDTSKAFVTNMLSANFHSIGGDPEAFKKGLESKMNSNYILTNLALPEDRDFVDLLADWYIESETDMTATVTTDRSMICKNGQVVCRTMVQLVVNQIGNPNKLGWALQEQDYLTIGKEYPVVIDVIFDPGDYSKIIGFRGYPGPEIAEIYGKK